MWEKALRQVDGGCVLRVEVSPGSARNSWVGYDQWREAVKVKVAAEPRRGKANDALASFVAKTFGVARSSVHILAGGKSRIKDVLIVSVDLGRARSILEGVVGG